jgi:4-amino-4-deoxy-L-arabinose transferase-like glycosyltransferase
VPDSVDPQQPLSAEKRRGTPWWNREDVLLLLLLGALFFLPGLGRVPLFDRDEPRFATAAREMGQSGDFMVPRFNGNLRPDKPPLIYWLMNVSYAAFGGPSDMAARIPSAIASMLTLIVIYFMVGSRFGRVTGLVAALIVGSCALFVAESRMATADATMILFIVSCMAIAWRAWDAGNPATAALPRTDVVGNGADLLDHTAPRGREGPVPFWMAMLFWVSLAAGALTKGVPLFFVLVPMVVLSIFTGTLPGQLRRWRSHFHLTGIRIGIASTVAVIAIGLVLTGDKIGLGNSRWAVGILGAIIVAMVLTPGLPGVLLRCFTGGNWKWWRQLRPFLGIPLLIALVGWWVVLAGMQTDWELIRRMVGVHFFKRAIGPLMELFGINMADGPAVGGNDAVDHYAKPPGTYLALVWVTFWPWSMVLVPSAFHAFRRLLGKTAIAIDRRPYQFLMAWIVPMWIILELSRGKLLHYPLPLYVGMAILCADALVQGWHRLTDVFAAPWFQGARWVVMVIWLGMGVGTLVAAKRFLEPEMFWRCVPLAGAFVAAGVAGAMAWGRPSWPFINVIGWAAALLALNTMVMPDLAVYHQGKIAGETLAELKREHPEFHIAAQGFEQPTLVFYAGQKVEMGIWGQIPFAPVHAVIPADQRYYIAVDQATLDDLKKNGLTAAVVRTIPGLDIEGFQRVRPNVYIISNVPRVLSRPATGTAPATTSGPATQAETWPSVERGPAVP